MRAAALAMVLAFVNVPAMADNRNYDPDKGLDGASSQEMLADCKRKTHKDYACERLIAVHAEAESKAQRRQGMTTKDHVMEMVGLAILVGVPALWLLHVRRKNSKNDS